MGGKPPYGMQRQATDNHGKVYVIPRLDPFRTRPDWQVIYIAGDPAELDVVRWMFETIDQKDVSQHWLAAELNRRGIAAPLGGLWRNTTISKMLKDEAYIGNYVFGKNHHKNTYHRVTPSGHKRNKGPGGKLSKGYQSDPADVIRGEGWWEPVIDPALFFRVQKILAVNSQQKRKPRAEMTTHTLSGILVCGHCGKGMLGGARKSKSAGTFIRYRCGSFLNHPGSSCKGWKVDEAEIMGTALTKLRELLTPERIREITILPTRNLKSDPVEDAKRLLQKIDAAIERGNKRICEIEDDRVVMGVLAELNRLYQERETTEAELRSLQAPEAVPEKILAWMKANEKTLHQWQLAACEKLLNKSGTIDYVLPKGSGKSQDELKVLNPLILRRLFLEIGLKLVCTWKEQKHSRSGKYVLDHVEILVDLEGVVNETTINRSANNNLLIKATLFQA